VQADFRFDVMGTEAHVLVNGVDAAAQADAARDALDELERRWSRFLPDSEISLLNAAGAAPVVVSPSTCSLIARAVDGWRITNGRFDPTVLGDVVRAGYDRTFDEVPAATAAGVSDRRRGCGGIEVDEDIQLVRMPPKVAFDPGGIGKGYSADLVVSQLMTEGARGACVNVGGDVRVAGRAADDTAWTIDVMDPFTESSIDRVLVADGGVATTSRTKRQWTVNGLPAHHVIDPPTGQPAASGLAAVTAIASDAWLAEVFAKAAFVAGLDDGVAFLEEHAIPALFTDDHGGRVTTTAWARFTAGVRTPH
jgi:thiamine biosynthesis lipoprotein